MSGSLTSCWHGTKSCWNLVKQFLMFLNPCSCQCNEDDEETQRLMKKAKRKRKRWLKTRNRKLQIYLSFKNVKLPNRKSFETFLYGQQNRSTQNLCLLWFIFVILNMLKFEVIILMWYLAKYIISLIRCTTNWFFW